MLRAKVGRFGGTLQHTGMADPLYQHHPSVVRMSLSAVCRSSVVVPAQVRWEMFQFTDKPQCRVRVLRGILWRSIAVSLAAGWEQAEDSNLQPPGGPFLSRQWADKELADKLDVC
ncbi:hypothetical protein LEMLEM_LOCUS200 [Lemmus lemmus]